MIGSKPNNAGPVYISRLIMYLRFGKISDCFPGLLWAQILCVAVFLQGCQFEQQQPAGGFGGQPIASDTEISAACVMGISTALADLEEIFQKGTYPEYSGFNEFFDGRFDTVYCREAGARILVNFFPEMVPGMRGGGFTAGGVSYVIDAKSQSVLNRTFGR